MSCGVVEEVLPDLSDLVRQARFVQRYSLDNHVVVSRFDLLPGIRQSISIGVNDRHPRRLLHTGACVRIGCYAFQEIEYGGRVESQLYIHAGGYVGIV